MQNNKTIPFTIAEEAMAGTMTGDSKYASDYNNDIIYLLRTDQFTDAEDLLLDALSHYPDDKELLVTANNAFRTFNDYNKSLHYANCLIQAHPSFFDGYCRAAQDLGLRLSRLEEAIDIISTGLNQFPDHPWVLYTAFTLYTAINQNKIAIELGDKLIQIRPAFHHIYKPYITLLINLDQLSRASEAIDKALLLFPTNFTIIRLKLELLLKERNHFTYRSFLYRLLKDFPDNSDEILNCLHRYEFLTSHTRYHSRVLPMRCLLHSR